MSILERVGQAPVIRPHGRTVGTFGPAGMGMPMHATPPPAFTAEQSHRLDEIDAKLGQMLHLLQRQQQDAQQTDMAVGAAYTPTTGVLHETGKEFMRAVMTVVATALGTYFAQRLILRAFEGHAPQEAHEKAVAAARGH